MLIRRATLRDLDALVEGNRAMAQETEGLTLDLPTLTKGVQAVLEGRQAGCYYVLERGGGVAAQLLITHEWSDWRNGLVWWIQSVYVWPDHRGQGHFGGLFRAVEAEARAASAVGLRLYVDTRNTRAQEVYRALGMDGEHYRVFERMFD